LEREPVDLVITDIHMPLMDGYDLARRIRGEKPSLPLLMLTADQSFDAKRTGFALGTDDYLTKPFEMEELKWRIETLLRRVRIGEDHKIRQGGITLDRDRYTLSGEGGDVQLPRKEFDLLFKLLSDPGRIFTKNQLLDDVWGYGSESSEDTVKTHISRLRNSLRDFPGISLSAVKGIGYKGEVTGREKE